MSTDRARISRAIQRIAREDPDIRDIIANYKNRGGIGSASATVAGADDGRQLCCDGSGSGSNNPGSETKDPSEGGQDGLNPDDPANLDDMGPGSLAGVTDCSTGEPVCFAGSDWVPPENWESPTEPPLDPSYSEGSYWKTNWIFLGGTSPNWRVYALSAEAGCKKSEELFLQDQPGNQDEDGNAFGSCVESPIDCPEDTGEWREVDGTYCNPGLEEFDEITADSWPSDDCINLAVKGGKFVASKYDPDVSSGNGWLKGKEEVELCDEFGNSFTVKASGSVEGGWKSISSQNPGDGYLYDATGKQVARISGSEYSDPSV